MSMEHAEALWLDEHDAVTFVELTQCSGFSADEVRELMELGVLEPAGSQGADPLFPTAALALMRAAARLRADFEVDTQGLALALTLLERVEYLESEVRALRAQLPRRFRP